MWGCVSIFHVLCKGKMLIWLLNLNRKQSSLVCALIPSYFYFCIENLILSFDQPFCEQRSQYDLEEDIRKTPKECHVSSSYRRASDVHSPPFGRSSNRRNWQENWKTYGNSQSRWWEPTGNSHIFEVTGSWQLMTPSSTIGSMEVTGSVSSQVINSQIMHSFGSDPAHSSRNDCIMWILQFWAWGFYIKGSKGIIGKKRVLVLIHWECSYTQLNYEFFCRHTASQPFSQNAYYGGRRVGVIGVLRFWQREKEWMWIM